MSPAMRGNSNKPELVAEAPVTTWRNSGRKTMAPNMAQPMRKASIELTVKMRSRNNHQQGGALEVDAVAAGGERQAQHAGRDDQGHQAHGEVDVEHPPPAQVVDEVPPEQRVGHAGQGEHRTQVAAVAASLPGRDDVADDGKGHGHEPAATDALDAPEDDELEHVLGGSGQHRAEEAEDDARVQQVALTPAGRRAHSELLQRRRAAMEAILADFSDADRSSLADLLERLVQGVNQVASHEEVPRRGR